MNPLFILQVRVDAMIADTPHMTLEEFGAHFRLLMFAWRSPGCCLPDDDARLARMLGITLKRWAMLKPAVIAQWVLSSGTYTNQWLTHEHAFVSAKVERKRTAGRLGGRPKSLTNNDPSKASGSTEDKQGESETKPPTPSPTTPPVVPPGDEPEGFAEFWAAYPERDGDNPRKTALRAYTKALRKGTKPAVILDAVRAFAAECAVRGKLGTEFVAQASTWLNQDRFERFSGSSTPLEARPLPACEAYLAGLSDERWRHELRRWKATRGHWPLRGRTEPPDDPQTKVPRHILTEFEIRHQGGPYEPKLVATA